MLRLLLAPPGCADFHPSDGELHLEGLVVVRPRFRNDFVAGHLAESASAPFLQGALEIAPGFRCVDAGEERLIEALDDGRRTVEPSVDVDGGNQRLHRIGEDGDFRAAAGEVFTVSEEQAFPEADGFRQFRQLLLVDRGGPEPREQALLRVRETLHQEVADDQLQHSVAEKFEAFIVRGDRGGVLVEVGPVDDGRLQTGSVAETVAEILRQPIEARAPFLILRR